MQELLGVGTFSSEESEWAQDLLPLTDERRKPGSSYLCPARPIQRLHAASQSQGLMLPPAVLPRFLFLQVRPEC